MIGLAVFGYAKTEMKSIVGKWVFLLESDNDNPLYVNLMKNGKMFVMVWRDDISTEGVWSITNISGIDTLIMTIRRDNDLLSEYLAIGSVKKDKILFNRIAQYQNGDMQNVPSEPVKATRYYPDLAPYQKDDVFGFRNLNTGKSVVQPSYISYRNLGKKLISVYTQNKWMLIDNTGKLVLEVFTYDNGPDYFKEGLARYVKDGKMGFFDENGKIVIQAQFDFVYPFEGGKAQFVSGGKQVSDGEHTKIEGGTAGTIDKNGKILE